MRGQESPASAAIFDQGTAGVFGAPRLAEALPLTGATGTGPHRPSAARRAGTAGRLLGLARGCAIVLVVAFVLLADDPALLAALPILAGVWLALVQSAHRAAHRSPVAMSSTAATGLGMLGGLLPVLAFSAWLPHGGPGTSSLILMALAAFALCAIVEGIAARGKAANESVLIVGGTDKAAALLEELAAHSGSPFTCVGVVTDDPGPEAVAGFPVLGAVRELTAIIRRERPNVVVWADGAAREGAVSGVLDAGVAGVRIASLADFYERAFGRVPLSHLPPVWFMSVFHVYQRQYSHATKRFLDVCTAVVGLVLAAPLFLIVAALVRWSSPGPVLFRQVRLGERGKPFTILKFRTMMIGAEEVGVARWAQHRDPRVTRVGRLLRLTHVDELPQLWNVLRGEMSMVGPRPERPEFLELLDREVPHWSRRHLLKPGMTGWAQVRRGYAAGVETTADKLSHDLYYLRHQSLLLDLVIMAMTAKALVSSSGAR